MKKSKFILWDSSSIELYGPREFQKNRDANGAAKDLMATFVHIIRECLKDCGKQSAVLKKFRVKIE